MSGRSPKSAKSGVAPRPARSYSAAVCGDGTILPILESLGRRHMREIDPLSSKGRDLLRRGRVTLCYEDGNRVEKVPIQEVLDRMLSLTRQRRDAYPELQKWTRHHDRVLRNISLMKSRLEPSH